MQPQKATAQPYSHTAKQAVEKLTPWQENNKYFNDKYTSKTNVKELYQGRYNNYGKR